MLDKEHCGSSVVATVWQHSSKLADGTELALLASKSTCLSICLSIYPDDMSFLFSLQECRECALSSSAVGEASDTLRSLSSVTSGNQPASRHDVQPNWWS